MNANKSKFANETEEKREKWIRNIKYVGVMMINVLLRSFELRGGVRMVEI